jgi:hypothetical protein
MSPTRSARLTILILTTLAALDGVLAVSCPPQRPAPRHYVEADDGRDAALGRDAAAVLEAFGEPQGKTRSRKEGEAEFWRYDELVLDEEGRRPRPVYIHFDAGGKVCRVRALPTKLRR